MSDHPELRVSDADRAAVTRMLEGAVGQGMLDLDEYSERVDDIVTGCRFAGPDHTDILQRLVDDVAGGAHSGACSSCACSPCSSPDDAGRC